MDARYDGAVMFIDLRCDALFDALGEDAAYAAVKAGVARLHAAVAAHGGRVVKTIGAEVMAAFPDAPEAAAAAFAMQRDMDAFCAGWPGGSQLHVGFTWGPLIEQDGDLFGDTVSYAARSGTVKSSTRIVVYGDALARLVPDLQAAARLVHAHVSKSTGRRSEYFELAWR